ncbi:MAG: isoprenylcysteine carboxylmethyltransferase family protein [Haliscomenobacteraceae bacterium CHB4]|nr:isoprenylcysteine carboxylmethyltransferase family protein [Haliscomenobacteraceae bacterium CHB4]
MKRLLVLLYGVVVYCLFFGTFLYMIGFVENLFVPKSIDGAPQIPLTTALLINAALLSLFALQHSIMARPAFKRWWTQFVPEPIERSTFVLFTCICLITMVYFWQPLGGVIWSVENDVLAGVLTGVSMIGWLVVLIATFMINHFDLFGLRQVWLYFQGKPYENVKFRLPLFYKYVRHPLYLGFLIAFWAAPVMTITHFFFAVMTTGYILTAIQLEERDLIALYGDKYRKYKKWAPMLIPFTKGKMPQEQAGAHAAKEAEEPASLY